jgi:SUF system NifU family Fe-S assembly protein
MDDLYRENILEHYKRPHHWGELEDPDLEFFDTNPLCGDELKVQIKVGDDGKVADVAFSGHGCAISQASASMASDELIGMPVGFAAEARARLRARPARHRDLGDAPEVRDALAEGDQVGQPRPRRVLGRGPDGPPGTSLGASGPPRLAAA